MATPEGTAVATKISISSQRMTQMPTSGGHGTLTGIFSQPMVVTGLCTKSKNCNRLPYFGLLAVVSGCLLFFGIGLSTLSAHSPATIASAGIGQRLAKPAASVVTAGTGTSPKPRQPGSADEVDTGRKPWLMAWLVRAIMFMVCTGGLLVLGIAIPLVPRREGAPLRVLIIGRISTPHQRAESIEASYEFVERYLGQAYNGPLAELESRENKDQVEHRQTAIDQ